MTWGVFQRPLTLILLQKYRDTNGRRIVIQIGRVYAAFCQEEGILLQKYRDRNGRCMAILFECIGVRGRCDSPVSPCGSLRDILLHCNTAPKLPRQEFDGILGDFGGIW